MPTLVLPIYWREEAAFVALIRELCPDIELVWADGERLKEPNARP